MIEATAIIGHGPSLKGKQRGKYIDSFKCVIRFPYIGNWQNIEDYGTKTSYICATTSRARHKLADTPEPDYGYYIWSKKQQHITDEFEHIQNKRDETKLIRSWQKRLPSSAYPYFSHGTAAACIAMARIKKPIVMFGCDALKSGMENRKDYIGSFVYENRRNNRSFHSFTEERKLIDTMSKHYNIEVVFE